MQPSAGALRQLLCALAVGACGCSTSPPAGPSVSRPALSLEAAEAERAKLVAQAPASFKMLHQVVAKYQEQSYLMTGYMLGRRDGSFLVSATAAMGPRLFAVAKVDGHWESRVYLKQLVERLDPTNVGRAVERIYFLPATGSLRHESGRWVSTSSIAGEEEIDTVEDWLDEETLALRRKRFFKAGKQVLQVDYSKLELIKASWIARDIELTDTRGFQLRLNVTEYEPGFPVTDAVLHVQSP